MYIRMYVFFDSRLLSLKTNWTRRKTYAKKVIPVSSEQLCNVVARIVHGMMNFLFFFFMKEMRDSLVKNGWGGRHLTIETRYTAGHIVAFSLVSSETVHFDGSLE